MNKDIYSNMTIGELIQLINKEVERRGGFKWWDPLSTPTVGNDKSSPLSLPNIGNRMPVDSKTYTVNNPSTGSIEPTRNTRYPAHGENPSNGDPRTSAAQLNLDELKNLIVGLSKIEDIDKFYARDEIENMAFRPMDGIFEVLEHAQNSELNAPLQESSIPATKNDPNGGMQNRSNPDYPVEHSVTYPIEDGKYVMPSGESDGEEMLSHAGLGITNFYDDYGAEPGDGNFHPYNRFTSEETNRDWNDQDNDRNPNVTKIKQGGMKSVRFGQNPRNPNPGDDYKSRPVYGGKSGSCNVACTGLCHITCDNECSESCTTTCWSRCGNACTASCGNACSGCSNQCYTSCKTKCETESGYSCLSAGAKTVSIVSTGSTYHSNNLSSSTYACNGCSYSCQFYPNKKTECWDAGCMGKCFTSCESYCSISCYGGCIDNNYQSDGNYHTGTGRGCSGNCTINCVGLCQGVCEGYCTQTCYYGCKESCMDNCNWTCKTNCGSGCEHSCTNGCTGCSNTCSGSCSGLESSTGCSGCSAQGGCVSTCQHTCDNNCIGEGCRSICGIESGGACEANCRMNCMSSSCTSKCENACSGECNTCVNTCGFMCGACSSTCSTGCGASCNITCTERCEHSCDLNCVRSCSEECGACSNLCYSCVGMCIGVCSVKCENGCSSCANNCGWWCDYMCNQTCFASCDDRCISTCSRSCSTYLSSETYQVRNDMLPTSNGYIYKTPKNRWEERESFKVIRNIVNTDHPIVENIIKITVANNELQVTGEIPFDYNFKHLEYNKIYVYDTDTDDMILDLDNIEFANPDNNATFSDSEALILTIDTEGSIKFDNIDISLPINYMLMDSYSEENHIILIFYKEPNVE